MTVALYQCLPGSNTKQYQVHTSFLQAKNQPWTLLPEQLGWYESF
jgi:hypothetical protein